MLPSQTSNRLSNHETESLPSEIKNTPATCPEAWWWKRHMHTFVTRVDMVTLYQAHSTGKFQAEMTSLPQTFHLEENKNLMKTSINHQYFVHFYCRFEWLPKEREKHLWGCCISKSHVCRYERKCCTRDRVGRGCCHEEEKSWMTGSKSQQNTILPHICSC